MKLIGKDSLEIDGEIKTLAEWLKEGRITIEFKYECKLLCDSEDIRQAMIMNYQPIWW